MNRGAKRRGVAALFTTMATVAALCAAALVSAPGASAGTGAQLYDLTCQGEVLGGQLGPTPTPILIASTAITPDPAFPTATDVTVVADLLVGVGAELQAEVLAEVGAGTGTVTLTAGSVVSVGASNSSTGPVDVDLSGNSTPLTGRAIGAVALTAGATSMTAAAGTFTVADEGSAVAVNSTDLPGALSAGTTIATVVSDSEVTLSAPAVAGGLAGAALADATTVLVPNVAIGPFTTDGVTGTTMDFLPQVTATTAINLDLGGTPATLNQTNDDGVNLPGCAFLDAASSTVAGADYLPFGFADLADPGPVINGGADLNVTASSAIPTTDILVTGTDDQGIVAWSITPVAAVGAATLTNYGVGDSTIIQYSPPSTTFEGVEQFEITADDGTSTSTQQVFIDVVGGDTSGQDVGTTVGSSSLDLIVCGQTGGTSADCSVAMPGVTLDGSTQTTAGAINQVTVVDARGLNVGWSLTAQLDGPLTNENWTLTGANAEIPAANLAVQNQQCTIVDGVGATVTPGAAGTLDAPVTLCTAAVGSSGGTFTADADLELTVPASISAGTYTGTITFILS